MTANLILSSIAHKYTAMQRFLDSVFTSRHTVVLELEEAPSQSSERL